MKKLEEWRKKIISCATGCLYLTTAVSIPESLVEKLSKKANISAIHRHSPIKAHRQFLCDVSKHFRPESGGRPIRCNVKPGRDKTCNDKHVFYDAICSGSCAMPGDQFSIAWNSSAVISSNCRFRVSMPKKMIAMAANIRGMAPINAVIAIDGGAIAATTMAMTRTPPNLLKPAISPLPRDRILVGYISAAYAESTEMTELIPQIGMISKM